MASDAVSCVTGDRKDIASCS